MMDRLGLSFVQTASGLAEVAVPPRFEGVSGGLELTSEISASILWPGALASRCRVRSFSPRDDLGGCVSLFQRFVVGVDVQGFSERPTRLQRGIQTALVRILDEAAESAGISRTLWERREEGDGETAVLPDGVDLLAVVRTFVSELDWRLTDHNEDHQPAMRLRLRVAMHVGAIAEGSLGYAGPALIDLQRLLDSDPVRGALAPGVNLAQIISEPLYQEVVLSELRGIRPAQFKKVLVDIPKKRFRRTAYVYVPTGGFMSSGDPPVGQPKHASDWVRVIGPVTPPPAPPPVSNEPQPSPEQPPAPQSEPLQLTAQVQELVRGVREALERNDIARADALTTSALLEAADRGRNGFLRGSDGYRLPDELFTDIDLAWAEFSEAAWGFRAQRKRINGRVLSDRRDFWDLSVMLGWRSENDGLASVYPEFVGRADHSRPFYPTLRLPAQEPYPQPHDEWIATVISVHVRLQTWEG